jgi:hypothetical protein
MIVAFLEFLARLAPLGTLIVALTAIVIAYNQLRTARQNEAKKQYFNYLDECVKYPKLAAGKYEENEKLAYIWFLNKALTAHESIYEVFPKDKHWGKAIKNHLHLHILNFTFISDEFGGKIDLDSYSEEFQILIRSIENEIINAAEANKGAVNERS